MNDRNWSDLAAAYALGALDEDERASFERRLAEDPNLLEGVERYEDIVALLGEAHPSEEPSPGLRQKILNRAGQGGPMGAAQAGEQERKGKDRHGSPSRSTSKALFPWLAAAAGFVLSFGLWTAYKGADRERTLLQNEIVAAREAAAEGTQALADRDSLLATFLGPEVHSVSLAAAEGPPTARVYWNHERQVFIVTAFGLPPAPAGSTYQLWAISPGSTPISMGTFNTDDRQSAATILAVSQEITDMGFITSCGLTLEPRGGSPQPTETPRLMGTWRHTD